MSSVAPLSLPAGEPACRLDPLRLAAVAYLARFTGTSRVHTESDLRIYLAWCAERSVDPLAVERAQVELYVRWMQEVRRFKPSTVSRRMAVVTGFYRTCVIDGVLDHSPAEHVRRPRVPPESPTLGLTHLQLEALLSVARDSANPCDFALVCLLGLLGLRIFEACGANIDDLGEEHGHRVLKVRGKGGKTVLVPLPSAVARAVERAAAGRGIRRVGTSLSTSLDAGVDLRDVQIAARHADPRTTMRYDRARNQLDRHPNYILAAYMASGT